MTPPSVPSHRALGAALVALLLAVGHAPAALAQGGGNGFLFKEPIGLFRVHGGFTRAHAGGDIYSFVQNELTLGRGDFDGLSGGAALSFNISRRWALDFDLSYGATSARSEFRDWVDQNDLPIEQSTSLRRLPITVSAKYYLHEPGQRIGSLAWIPARFAPYLGAGAGMTWYRFRQHGDFVDFQTLGVFRDDFRSQSWTTSAHVLAGADLSLSPRFALTTEMRYSYARAPMGDDFVGFDHIDLSGLTATVGLSIRLTREWAR